MIFDIIEPKTLLFIIIVSILAVIPIFLIANQQKKKVQQLKQYVYISLGMSEHKMLSIMGSGYNRSLLKNGVSKYEWRINATSYGSSYKGMSYRSYSGVKKVTIYTRNGYVEEIKPYNV